MGGMWISTRNICNHMFSFASPFDFLSQGGGALDGMGINQQLTPHPTSKHREELLSQTYFF